MVRTVVLGQGLSLGHILPSLRIAVVLRAGAMIHARTGINPNLGVGITGATDSSSASIPVALGPGRVLVPRLP